jgi:hypothetical protein
MRKLLTCAIVLALTSGAAMAQSGNWYVGGALGATSNTKNDKTSGIDLKTKTSTWTVAPEIGTFLSDHIQLGLALGLNGGGQKEDKRDAVGTYTIQRKSFSFAPTVYGRYFWSVSDNLSVFAALYLSYGVGSNKQLAYTQANGTTSPETKTTSGTFGTRLGIGLAYALSDRFTVVGQYGLFGFSSTTNKDNNGTITDTNTSADFGVNTVGAGALLEGNGSGSPFNVGLYYTFIKK